MRILITGSRGMVGTALVKVLSNHTIITPKRYELNVGNPEQVMRFTKIDFIIHTAAETDHELCDINPLQTYYINTIGTAHMVKLAKHLDVPIVYVSAGSIFDGENRSPYFPLAEPNPINHYNTSKYLGEQMVRPYKKHYIIRAGWMFGGGPEVDKKMVNKLIVKIRAGQKDIKFATDCIGSPTYSIDFAQAISELVDGKRSYGTYHATNEPNGVSRYEFAKEVVKHLKKSGVTIVPCKIDDLKEEFPCKRTNYEVLWSSFTLRPYEKALKEYIIEYYKH